MSTVYPPAKRNNKALDDNWGKIDWSKKRDDNSEGTEDKEEVSNGGVLPEDNETRKEDV